jgi:hypothetical protein
LERVWDKIHGNIPPVLMYQLLSEDPNLIESWIQHIPPSESTIASILLLARVNNEYAEKCVTYKRA